jgi:hypothetical protein
MNPTKERNGDLCEIAMHCCSKGSSSLTNFPGLMKEIIETKAWERREWRGKVFELPSLKDLIERKPLEGWGESIDKVQALIKDDPQVLRMFRRETVAEPHKHKADSDNITIKTPTSDDRGTGKSYSLDLLARKAPDMFQAVCNGELTANAAMIQAGLRKSVVSVGANPASAAKTLKKKFGLDYVQELIKELSKQ